MRGCSCGARCTKWRLDDIRDAADACTAELVGNAVGISDILEPEPRWSNDGQLSVLRVHLRVVEGELVIEVQDADEAPPSNPGKVRTVEDVSKQWAYYIPDSGGKVVWCALELPRPPLSKRMPQPVWEPNRSSGAYRRHRGHLPGR